MVRKIAVSLSAIALVVLTAPTASAAPPSRATCSPNDNYVKACLDPYNDQVWVYDAEPDGASAAMRWTTAAGGGPGWCVKSNGAGTWKVCDYDFVERYTAGDRTCPNVLYWGNWTIDRSRTPDDYDYISGTYSAYIEYPARNCTIRV
ncbi:hypothetical protein [Phycicoccus avicenniae]|uniref:hypothetical protein n=1 Tax=Phycicoccus avicenniae TaxID=2828860 RepID=UPI003D26F237